MKHMVRCACLAILLATALAIRAEPSPPSAAAPPLWSGSQAVRTAVETSVAQLGVRDTATLSLSELSVLVARRWSDSFELGLALRYTRLDPEQETGALVGPAWSPVHELGAAWPVSQAWAGGRARFAPSLRWSAEEGADWSEAATLGLLFSQTWPLAGGDELGLGAVISHGLGRTRFIPFPLVRWNFGEHWQVGNSIPLGPATPAGLELRWRPASQWTLGAGFAYRNDRYLRADEEHVAEWRSVPIWLRATYRYGPAGLTLWGGAAVARRIDLRDTDGNRLASEEPSPAPLLGLSLTVRF